MELIGKQIRQLRSLAHHMEPAVMVGQSGVTPAVIETTRAYLDKHELVKINVLPASGIEARAAAEAIAEALDAGIVQVIGHKVTLYRPSEREGIQHIQLVR